MPRLNRSLRQLRPLPGSVGEHWQFLAPVPSLRCSFSTATHNPADQPFDSALSR